MCKNLLKKYLILGIILLFISAFIIPLSESIKVLKYNSSTYEEAFNGYILFTPEYSKETYLINKEKEIVHSWKSNYVQGLAVYLLENGDLFRSDLPYINPTFMTGGISGRVEKFDWNSTLLWEFEYSNSKHCLHHDIEPLPNGNILMIAWEYKTLEEAITAGRDPKLLPFNQFWPDHIIEVEPVGSSGGNIVWEWHVWDHLIQDYDPSKDNYGVVEDHPELIDINFGGILFRGDFNHINSIDYNQEFDQILISASHQNEIWVIDHSTTTEEAAGHAGGNSGKGGDILYRWGNPRTYRAGNSSDQKFFGQHDAQWIESGCPGESNILVFNNGIKRPGFSYSSVDEIIPPVDSNGNYSFIPGTAYEPENILWTYTAKNPSDFYAQHLSGAQRLNNGNTLICNGPAGIFFEVTHEKATIWDYVNPYPDHNKNDVFKIRHYPPDYPGLAFLFYQPDKPSKPNGPSNGKIGIEYTYSTFTTDPQSDQVFYLFNWGDGTETGWLGPYPSGETIEANHTWTKQKIYQIKVKAKDIIGYESGWSDPLTISIPRIKISSNNLFIRLFRELLEI